MATKNLARTIIEGGRARYNKFERRYSHRQERALARAYFSRASKQAEGFEALSIRERTKVYKGFDDKLGAPRRWLRSQVGRPWNKVRSEIFTRFNPRSLAGQHIIFDHLLEEVRVHEVVHWRAWRYDLYVDRHGILRAPPQEKRREQQPREQPGRRGATSTEAQAWADGRRIAERGTELYWLVFAGTCDSCVLLAHRSRSHCCCPSGRYGIVHRSHHHYRQERRLTPEEAAFWKNLAEATQELLRYTNACEIHR